VSSGTGSLADPYIVGPWAINSGAGDAVHIDGAHLTKSFVLSNLVIAGNGSAGNGIVLGNINPLGTPNVTAAVTGTQTAIQNRSVGIVVSNSSYVLLDGKGANSRGPGIASTGAGTINQNAQGAIDIENSTNITVRGWQLSANGADHTPDWVGLDPSIASWGVGGIRLFSVTQSTVDHNAANNDTDNSFSLFASSYDTVSDNTADYPFTANVVVADGSSFDTVVGNVLGTADFIGVLVADPLPGTASLAQYGPTHDITVENNFDHSDGPTGNEIHGGVAPAFAGGIVVLNGTYDNVIAGNQSPGKAGFVWAQAVPDPSTTIAVATYPPRLLCNVTASEGGGGPANLNGNSWSANTSTFVAPCIPAQ
jgi:parallel beta-helix repeat protein